MRSHLWNTAQQLDSFPFSFIQKTPVELNPEVRCSRGHFRETRSNLGSQEAHRGVAMHRVARLFQRLYHRQFMARVIFSHEKCSTSPYHQVVNTFASSGGEEGRRQDSKSWFWKLQANCWETNALASGQSFVLIAAPAQENTRWTTMQKLLDREARYCWC